MKKENLKIFEEIQNNSLKENIDILKRVRKLKEKTTELKKELGEK